MNKLKNRIERKGPLRSIVEGVLLCLLFVGMRYAFNLVLLPAIFPEASGLEAYHVSTLASLLLAVAFWLGLPYFSVFTLLGLLLSRVLTAHYSLLEGSAFPSLMANVLTTASQGGGFLIGAVSEYAIWFSRRISSLRLLAKPSSPTSPTIDEAEELID